MQSTCGLMLVLATTSLCPATALQDTGRMQPGVVAQSLLRMENEWRSEAQVFAECNATESTGTACQPAVKAFEKSCGTIVSAVQQASSGDRTVVTQYMGEICQQPVLEGWHKARCQSLAATITGAMTADNYDNREQLDVAGLCQSYWSRFASEEAVRVAKEREAQAVEEKRLQALREEAAKQAAVKAAAEAAAKEKRRQEEAAEQEKRIKSLEAAKVEAEAKQKAEEVKLKAAEEAANLKAKEEEALRQAEEAKHKMEELKAAAEEAHKKSVEKAAEAAKETKHNATAPVNAKVAAAAVVVPAKQQKTNATAAVVVPAKQ